MCQSELEYLLRFFSELWTSFYSIRYQDTRTWFSGLISQQVSWVVKTHLHHWTKWVVTVNTQLFASDPRDFPGSLPAHLPVPMNLQSITHTDNLNLVSKTGHWEPNQTPTWFCYFWIFNEPQIWVDSVCKNRSACFCAELDHILEKMQFPQTQLRVVRVSSRLRFNGEHARYSVVQGHRNW